MNESKSVIKLYDNSILHMDKEYFIYGCLGSDFTKITNSIINLETFSCRLGKYKVIARCSRYFADICFVTDPMMIMKSDFTPTFEKKILFDGIIQVYEGEPIVGTDRYRPKALVNENIWTSKDICNEFEGDKGLKNLLLGFSEMQDGQIDKAQQLDNIEAVIRGYHLQEQTKIDRKFESVPLHFEVDFDLQQKFDFRKLG